VNGERFITPELKEFESKILGADERARAEEIETFSELRNAVLNETSRLQETATTLAVLDSICRRSRKPPASKDTAVPRSTTQIFWKSAMDATPFWINKPRARASCPTIQTSARMEKNSPSSQARTWQANRLTSAKSPS
jgi:hypothetical protein